MIEACDRHGYRATTTRELVALAGVSKKALYQHFDSKADCFFRTFDLVVRQAAARIVTAYRAAPDRERDWSAGLCRAFEAFIAELVERPGPSRLALIDVLAVGPEASGYVDRAEDIFIAMICQSLAQAPDGLAISRQLLRPLIGGIWFVSRNSLMEGEAEGLADSAPALLSWILAYRGVEAVPGVRPRPAVRSELMLGGREDRLAERTRLIRATAALVADGGFGALSEPQIVAVAGTDPASFGRYFEDVGGCFLATLDHLAAAALARAMRESSGAPDWPTGVHLAIQAIFSQIAEDRALARAAFLDEFSADPAGSERRAALMRGFADAFLRRVPRHNRPIPLVAEAIVGSIWSLARRRVLVGQAATLPALSAHGAFLALAPILGAEQARAALQGEVGSPFH
jgi:AcrR family transcriptional regulator